MPVRRCLLLTMLLAGVIYALSKRIGLRGDLRYFRALVDEDKRERAFSRDYGFWRTTFGVTLGFPP